MSLAHPRKLRPKILEEQFCGAISKLPCWTLIVSVRDIVLKGLLSVPQRFELLETQSHKNQGFARQGGFQKGGFGRCSPVPKFPPKCLSFPAVLPWQKKAMISLIFLHPRNRNEGTFAQTALLFPKKWPICESVRSIVGGGGARGDSLHKSKARSLI